LVLVSAGTFYSPTNDISRARFEGQINFRYKLHLKYDIETEGVVGLFCHLIMHHYRQLFLASGALGVVRSDILVARNTPQHLPRTWEVTAAEHLVGGCVVSRGAACHAARLSRISVAWCRHEPLWVMWRF
jgi:hypothetical protein